MFDEIKRERERGGGYREREREREKGREDLMGVWGTRTPAHSGGTRFNARPQFVVTDDLSKLGEVVKTSIGISVSF